MTDTPPSPTVAPADGKLGVLCVGLGAVTTTLIAGVELAKRGDEVPVGSLTQLGTIRLGKRTDDNVPRFDGPRTDVKLALRSASRNLSLLARPPACFSAASISRAVS